MVNPKNFLAVSCAVGLGVVTGKLRGRDQSGDNLTSSGLYTFGPAFEEEAQKKRDLAL